MQKRFDEYFAKVVLESCFPEKFADLQIADKPDLRCGDKVGIEVTNCTPERVIEVENLFRVLSEKDERARKRSIERINQLGAKYLGNVQGGTLMLGFPGVYTNNVDISPTQDFLNAVEKKIERLNSDNANYENMTSYELFIASATIIIPQFQINTVMERLQELNSKPKKFDCIYLVTSEQKLLIFDLAKTGFDIKHMHTHFKCMSDKALELYKGAKQ